MFFIEIILLSVGLSMDSLAASVTTGSVIKEYKRRHIFRIASIMAMFQAGMTMIGYFAGIGFSNYICRFDHWIAFFLLLFIGGKMIIESFKKDKDSDEKPEYEEKLDLKELTLMAVATSIDALAVGVTFAFLQVNILTSITVIGSVTFILSALGVGVGHKFGAKYKNKAELCGGIILVLIGIKILLEHLGVLSF